MDIERVIRRKNELSYWNNHRRGFDFRLHYIYRPGDDFFFIFNEGRRVDGPLEGQVDRTVQGKLTYSLDFEEPFTDSCSVAVWRTRLARDSRSSLPSLLPQNLPDSFLELRSELAETRHV